MYLSLRSLLIGAIAATFIANGANAEDAREIRMPPGAFDFNKAEGAGAGTSGVTGIQTIVLKGDPTKHGLYTILLRVPAHTKIAAHHHPDDRIATVVSGTWYFGYGCQVRRSAATCAAARQLLYRAAQRQSFRRNARRRRVGANFRAWTNGNDLCRRH